MILPLVASLLLAADADWKRLDEVDGILVESRPVPASSFVELRLSTTTAARPEALCNAVFGTGKFDAGEPDLKSRRVLQESEHERVTFDQISPPVVSDRDYTVRTRRSFEPDGRCRIVTESANELAPPARPGWVRITKIRVNWLAEPLADGKTRFTYRIHTDPAGSVPAFLVEGTRRTLAVKWMKMIVSRASRP